MKIKEILKNNRHSFILVFVIFFLDRISKIYVMHLEKSYFEINIFQSKFLNITPIWNKGISFGLFSFDDRYKYHILTSLILIIVLFLISIAKKEIGIKKFSFLIIIGGAIGNLYDRIRFNAVFDFIDLHIGGFHWFIFNVSDIFITLGIFFLIYLEIVNKKKNNLS